MQIKSIKRIGVYVLVTAILFLLLLNVHNYVLTAYQKQTVFSLKETYLFFAIASLFIYIHLELVKAYLPAQIGFVFLAFIVLKSIFFVAMYRQYLLGDFVLHRFERLSFLVPMFFYLVLECLATVNLLRENEHVKKS